EVRALDAKGREQIVHQPLRIHATTGSVARRVDLPTPSRHNLGERVEVRVWITRDDCCVEELERGVPVRRSIAEQTERPDQRLDLGSIKRPATSFQAVPDPAGL